MLSICKFIYKQEVGKSNKYSHMYKTPILIYKVDYLPELASHVNSRPMGNMQY